MQVLLGFQIRKLYTVLGLSLQTIELTSRVFKSENCINIRNCHITKLSTFLGLSYLKILYTSQMFKSESSVQYTRARLFKSETCYQQGQHQQGQLQHGQLALPHRSFFVSFSNLFRSFSSS